MSEYVINYLLQTIFTLAMVSTFFAAIVNDEQDIPRKSVKYTVAVCSVVLAMVGLSYIFS